MLSRASSWGRPAPAHLVDQGLQGHGLSVGGEVHLSLATHHAGGVGAGGGLPGYQGLHATRPLVANNAGHNTQERRDALLVAACRAKQQGGTEAQQGKHIQKWY